MDTYITYAAQIFDDIIVKNIVPITDLPPVLQCNLFESTENSITNFWKQTKQSFLNAALTELSQSIELCRIPPFSELFNSSKTNQLEWDAIQLFKQGTRESFMEQKEAMSINVQRVNEYMDIFGSIGGQFIKSIGVHGAPGSGK